MSHYLILQALTTLHSRLLRYITSLPALLFVHIDIYVDMNISWVSKGCAFVIHSSCPNSDSYRRNQTVTTWRWNRTTLAKYFEKRHVLITFNDWNNYIPQILNRTTFPKYLKKRDALITFYRWNKTTFPKHFEIRNVLITFNTSKLAKRFLRLLNR